jgi:hypothetical protein
MASGAASSIPKSLPAEDKARVLLHLPYLPDAIDRQALTATPTTLLEALFSLASLLNAIRMPTQLEVLIRLLLHPPQLEGPRWVL